MTLVLLAFLLISLVVVLIVSVHPFWAIVECAVSTKLEGARKGVWILAMLLTWTFGSFLYGLFATYSPALRRVTRICTFLIIILVLVGGALFATNPELQQAVLEQAQTATQQSNPTVAGGSNEPANLPE